jgi:DNA invertase Pin-like site-specific DNA recombinase
MRDPQAKATRCAIYTRKSSEEGLEQDFNSLHAQREACEAYVTSQKHEGWRALPATYDDGGFSGGSMERPGLQRLLADIQSGAVDVVVVYKVDRLTRSLTDFAKIVEIFDRHGVSFVSVTQSFNTTTSMGRLTLNVLLSFAQFEREVTGERIRDKIAASKKKGMWMGGYVPLGYGKKDRSLVIVEGEAEVVRTLYRLYLEHGTVAALKLEADRQGLRSKLYEGFPEHMRGGKPFSRGHLYKILSNSLYVGEIDHKGTRYPGQHEAVVDRETWDAVQARLSSNGHERQVRSRARQPNLLTGLLVDEHGTKLTSTHTVKDGKRYRYYVGSPEEGARAAVWRLPAHDIEALVTTELTAFLCDQQRLFDALQPWAPSPDQLEGAFHAGEVLSEQLKGSAAERRDGLLHAVREVRLRGSELMIELQAWTLLGADRRAEAGGAEVISVRVPMAFQRRAAEMKIIVPGREIAAAADPALVKAIARGHAWFEELATGEAATIMEIARRENVTDRYVSSLLKLAFLSPAFVEGCLRGEARGVSAKLAMNELELPILWCEQAETLARRTTRGMYSASAGS